MNTVTKRPPLRSRTEPSPSQQNKQTETNRSVWVPDPPPLFWWRIGGILSILSVIPYVYVIKKTPINWCLAVIISLNPLVRTFFPSQYVPARNSNPYFISHPCLARFLATIAEPIFLWAEAICIGVPFWNGPMGILTILGESISWVHLLVQSELIGIVEDSTWVLVQIVAFATGSGIFTKTISLPFITYNFLFHLPRQIKRVFKVKFCEGWSGSKQEPMDADTFIWIIPSLLAQQIVFTVFLMYMNENGLDFIW